MRNLSIAACLILFISYANSQSINEEIERIKLDSDMKHLYVGIDLSPDGNYIAISGNKEFPLYIYDWKKREIVNTFNVGDWFAGSAINFSKNGKYILIQQLKMMDWAPNKDKEVTFDIIESESGKKVIRLDPYHAVAITPDEKYAIALTADELSFWNLENGKKERSFSVERASNGLAISPDGSMLAVSHHVTEEALAKVPRYQKDKKARKAAAKYKQEITVYDLNTFDKKFNVNEFYDIVYKLHYSNDGKTLFCLQIPHMKTQATANARQTYISTINGLTGEASRKGYTSNATYEPDFKLNSDGSLFGVVSQGSQFLELHIYDSETAKMKYRYKQSYRLLEKSDGDYIIGDSRTTFVFLPDGKNILMTQGNRLILWNMKSEN